MKIQRTNTPNTGEERKRERERDIMIKRTDDSTQM